MPRRTTDINDTMHVPDLLVHGLICTLAPADAGEIGAI
jgi:hypothetical protein